MHGDTLSEMNASFHFTFYDKCRTFWPENAFLFPTPHSSLFNLTVEKVPFYHEKVDPELSLVPTEYSKPSFSPSLSFVLASIFVSESLNLLGVVRKHTLPHMLLSSTCTNSFMRNIQKLIAQGEMTTAKSTWAVTRNSSWGSVVIHDHINRYFLSRVGETIQGKLKRKKNLTKLFLGNRLQCNYLWEHPLG